MASPAREKQTPIQRLTRPFVRFLHVQAAGGIALVAATVVALIMANSSLSAGYQAFWNETFQVGFGSGELRYPLWYWVNDGLMVLFFFVVGLEIKRELVHGELRDRRNIVLPAAGAVGGAVVPVALFLAFVGDGPSRAGWAVPMATDIAFVVGCLAILGSRVPPALKIFVLSLAIIDDLLAVIIIAAFFSDAIVWMWVAFALGGLLVVMLMNTLGVRAIAVYVFVGAFIWLATLKAGIHPTVAGALLGLLTPAHAWIARDRLHEVVQDSQQKIQSSSDTQQLRLAADLSDAAVESVSPLARLEHGLHPWVVFVIIPIFALANAGVPIGGGGAADSSIAMGVAGALLLGKPLGIALSCALMVRVGWATLPAQTSWRTLVGAASLCGIGFTMSLFIASLSLTGAALIAAKMGILAGSTISMMAGMAMLAWSLPSQAKSARA